MEDLKTIVKSRLKDGGSWGNGCTLGSVPPPVLLKSSPKITSVSSVSIRPGESVTITGSGFSPAGNIIDLQNGTYVHIYYELFNLISTNNGNTLTFVLPPSPVPPVKTIPGKYFLKLSAEKSDISSCDGEDLRKFFAPKGRIFFGKSLCEPDEKLGNNISRKSVELSFCPSPAKNADCGVLLQVLNEKNANDERVAEHINASVSFVGNMCQTLYQGVYIRNEVDGIGSFIGFSGLKD